MRFEKIISVKPIGQHRSVDITVSNNNHLFWGDGILTSNSHSVAFAYHSYKSAYAKANKTLKFFQVYLKHAKHKIKPKEEIRKLVQNARASDITICCPDLRIHNKEFEIHNDRIYTGIVDIKTIGDRIHSMLSSQEAPKNWFEFLALSIHLKSAAKVLIQAGACDFYHLDRRQMEYELSIFERFSDLEKSKILSIAQNTLLDTLNIAVQQLKIAKNRLIIFQGAIKDLTTPAYKLFYTAEQLEKIEIELIGAPLSCTRLDGNKHTALANIHCIDIIKNQIPKKAIVAGIIRNPKIILTKKKTEMCFMSLEDHTGTAENIIVFEEALKEYRHNIVEDLGVLLIGTKSQKGGMIVSRIIEI